MPIPLKSSHKDGKVYIVQLEIGPAFARQKNAETAVIVGKITGKPIELEDALKEQKTLDISGTMLITFDTDSDGKLYRQTQISTVKTIHPNGDNEIRTAENIIERMLISKQ